MVEKKIKSHCAINSALEVLGDKWSLLIVRDLMFNSKRYFGDFLKSEEGIATNILASRLSVLEQAGIIVKQSNPRNKLKFIYKLSHKGIDLLPILLEMMFWSATHDQQAFINPALEKVYRNPEFINQTSHRLKQILIDEDLK
ncbi:winged helix-turn-helix transcriptional regulator [Pedobacter sp. AW1-32]|uniref:winged helix-turn-helix transcriptional regulator n=1 Tax=Pedobacter sp. AW1-32 TaxID=3383026 RepID=UPI003FF0F748